MTSVTYFLILFFAILFSKMKVAVIGGGPSGLVTLKYLINAHNFFPIEHIEARLFESEASIGGTFTHRTDEDAEVGNFFFLHLIPGSKFFKY